MQILWWFLGIVGALFLLYILYSFYLAIVLRWEDENTVGLKYYGLPPEGRAAFKHKLRRHARLLGPLLRFSTRLATMDFRKSRIQYQGVSAPPDSCSVESFERGTRYQPTAQDIFIATQMKCGTTWMQQVVYEILNRGAGDIVASGKTMYSISPWIEGRKSVPIDQAPLVGTERPSRIIKTHYPAQLCPSAPEAKYIYVARHPASCYASCVDFVKTNVGAAAPAPQAFFEWFTSPELMWWGTWTDHVAGWWDRAQKDRNVLFLYFEDMKRDLPGVIRQVAAFLGVKPLTDAEVAKVAEKSSFRYMQQHQDSFEMHPPHIMQTSAELFVSGTADRHKDVDPAVRERVLAWAARDLAGRAFPLSDQYPDVARSAAAA
jgi:hypothetical protein